jgi:hypothetical protein
MKRDNIKKLLKGVASDSETLRLLKDDPEGLAKKYGLSEDEVKALKKAKVLIALRPTTYTFETGMTIEV